MCLWNRDAPGSNKVKISKSYILTPPNPKGQVMSVKSEQPKDKLTVHIWLLYDHPNFKMWAAQNYRQTEKQTDGRSEY